MTRPEVNQVVPQAVPGDATTDHALATQRLLRELGHRSEVFALAVHDDLAGQVRLVQEMQGPSTPDRFLIYQCASHSPLGDWLYGRREHIAVYYHNVTPPDFLRGWDPAGRLALIAGHLQVAQLARVAEIGIAASAANAADLRAKGWTQVTVAPLLLDLSRFVGGGACDGGAGGAASVGPSSGSADAGRTGGAARTGDTGRTGGAAPTGGARWLFVGSLAPHKAQHLLVQALATYRSAFDPDATLTLVGRPVVSSYARAVDAYAAALGIGDAVTQTGGISHQALLDEYQRADVVVCASQHEGFCVPIAEAMAMGRPLVVVDTGEVATTAGVGGVVVPDARPGTLATAVHRVVTDPVLRRRLAGGAAARVAELALDRSRRSMTIVLERWLSGRGAADAGTTRSDAPEPRFDQSGWAGACALGNGGSGARGVPDAVGGSDAVGASDATDAPDAVTRGRAPADLWPGR